MLPQIFKFRYDHIIAAAAVYGFAQLVMDLFASVKAQYNIVHFLIGKINDIVIDQNTVCC